MVGSKETKNFSEITYKELFNYCFLLIRIVSLQLFTVVS